uniref:Uncharacterized protein n=1 Tax=Panagrolaimus davidi TaxID=227884 RepID=A0A914QH74_9BILA
MDLTKAEKDLVIQEGAVPYLAKLFYDDWKLENVAAYTLSNLSLTDNKRSIQILMNEGCIPALITGINSSDFDTCDLSAYAIANLRYKSEEKFHEYIDSFLLPELVKLLKSPFENRQIVAAEVISLIASRIQWKAIFATENIPLLVKFVDSSNSLMCKKAVEALFYLTTNKAFTDAYTLEAKNNIIVAGAIPYITKLLSSTEHELISLSLSLLTNLSAGSNEHKQAVIQTLPNLVKLLSSSDNKICNEATLVILAVSCGTIDQKQAIINAGACDYLLKYFQH